MKNVDCVKKAVVNANVNRRLEMKCKQRKIKRNIQTLYDRQQKKKERHNEMKEFYLHIFIESIKQ